MGSFLLAILICSDGFLTKEKRKKLGLLDNHQLYLLYISCLTPLYAISKYIKEYIAVYLIRVYLAISFAFVGFANLHRHADLR